MWTKKYNRLSVMLVFMPQFHWWIYFSIYYYIHIYTLSYFFRNVKTEKFSEFLQSICTSFFVRCVMNGHGCRTIHLSVTSAPLTFWNCAQTGRLKEMISFHVRSWRTQHGKTLIKIGINFWNRFRNFFLENFHIYTYSRQLAFLENFPKFCKLFVHLSMLGVS